MKIALFCDTYKPVKNWLVSMVSHIKSSLEVEGHEVYLFCPDYPDYIDTEKNIFRIKSVWTPLKLDDRLPITLKKKKEIKQFLIEKNIDVIHSHSEFILGRLAKKFAKELNIKYIHTFHTMWEDYAHYLMVPKISIRKAVQHFLKNVEYITSPSIKSCWYLKQVLRRDDIIHIPNFIDEWKLRRSAKKNSINILKDKYNITHDDIIVSFVGRVSSEKRVFELVKTYDTYIFPKNKHIKLIIIGDGKQFKKIQKYIAKSIYKNNYILTGYIEWEHINMYYKLSDIYTTISISETHPMTVTEAVFLWLPCVVVEDDSFHGLVTDGVNWYIWKDAQDYSSKILSLASEPETRKKFTKESKKIAKSYISKNIIKKYIELYEI